MQRIFLNVGYELTEKQLRAHLTTFGTLSDLYLPKHSNGRNKGYGFATFASAKSLALALQQPKHVIDGITVQVSRAGVRPPDVLKDSKNSTPAKAQQAAPFGSGPRVYVGGVPDFVTGERVREHFGQWGFVTDVYFPISKGQKRMNYCFVSFQSQESAERACHESPRNLDGWPLQSISMAEDRKLGPSASNSPNESPRYGSQSPGFDLLQDPGQLDAASLPGYVAQLQLRYQQHLAAAMASMAAPTQAARPSSHKPLESLPYAIPDFKHPQLEERHSYSGSFDSPSSHRWWLENLSSQPLGQSLDHSEFSPQKLALHGFPSDPSLLTTRGPSAANNSSGSEYSADNLTMLAQQSVANAAADRLNSQVSLSGFNSAMSNAYRGNLAEGSPMPQYQYYNDASGLPYF